MFHATSSWKNPARAAFPENKISGIHLPQLRHCKKTILLKNKEEKLVDVLMQLPVQQIVALVFQEFF